MKKRTMAICVCGEPMWPGSMMCKSCRADCGYGSNRISLFVALGEKMRRRNITEIESLKASNSAMRLLLQNG